MRIFIAGAGAVGTHLARMLSKEAHDITLMDEDAKNLQFITDNQLEILPFAGNPIDFGHLTNARVANSELFIAVTPEESTNLLACSFATELGVKKTIARITNTSYLHRDYVDYFNKLGIDELISPEAVAASEIASTVKLPWSNEYWTLFQGKLSLLSVTITEHSSLIGRQLMHLSDMETKIFHIVSVVRDGEGFIPMGSDVILEGDVVYITCMPENLDIVRAYTGQEQISVNRVIIMGGGSIALQTAWQIPSDIMVKIIELDYEKCMRLTDKVPANTLIIHGDGREPDLLISEGLKKTAIFIALTDHSEGNMIASINAKRLGVPKVITEVENMDYMELAEQMKIGKLINKKIIAAATIFRHLLTLDVNNAKTLSAGQAEVFEVTVKPGSKMTKHKVREIKLPNGVTLGGFMRRGFVMLVEGDTQLEPGDQVVIFSTSHTLSKTLKYFS